MAFLPIWTCCFGPIPKHASNAEIENHFAIMKSEKQPSKRFTEAEFLEERFKSVKDEINIIVRRIFLNNIVYAV